MIGGYLAETGALKDGTVPQFEKRGMLMRLLPMLVLLLSMAPMNRSSLNPINEEGPRKAVNNKNLDKDKKEQQEGAKLLTNIIEISDKLNEKMQKEQAGYVRNILQITDTLHEQKQKEEARTVERLVYFSDRMHEVPPLQQQKEPPSTEQSLSEAKREPASQQRQLHSDPICVRVHKKTIEVFQEMLKAARENPQAAQELLSLYERENYSLVPNHMDSAQTGLYNQLRSNTEILLEKAPELASAEEYLEYMYYEALRVASKMKGTDSNVIGAKYFGIRLAHELLNIVCEQPQT